MMLNDATRLGEVYEGAEAKATSESSGSLLAETAFRLAVHPSTDAGRSLELLLRGRALDPLHPRYSYHVARLYFASGQLELAQAWLDTARKQCPTSHRIWSHVSLLQWFLNEETSSDKRYRPNELRDRGDALAAAVRGGAPFIERGLLSFGPESTNQRGVGAGAKVAESHGPRSNGTSLSEDQTPGRGIDAAACRWSGIDDLLLERLLTARPSQRLVAKLEPFLAGVARAAATRVGGESAFCISALQWLIVGYPAATVRRLQLEHQPRGGWASPLYSVVERFCELVEGAGGVGAEHLAELARDERIPPSLFAIAHHRCVLWRPLDYPSAVHYREARRVLVCARDPDLSSERRAQLVDEAAGLARKLDTALEALVAPRPKGLVDVARHDPARSEVDGASLATRLADLGRRSRALLEVKKAAFDFLKGELVPAIKAAESDGARRAAAADLGASKSLVVKLAERVEVERELLKAIHAGASALAEKELPASYQSDFETCEAELKEACNLGSLKRALARAERGAVSFDVDPAVRAGESVRGLLDTLEAAASPPATLDSPDQALPEADLAAYAAALQATQGEIMAFLRGPVRAAASGNDARSVAAAQQCLGRVRGLVESMGELAQAGLARAEAQKQGLVEVEAGDALTRVEVLENGISVLREVASLGKFRRLLANLDRAASQTEGGAEPAGDLLDGMRALEERLQALRGPSTTGQEPHDSTTQPSPAPAPAPKEPVPTEPLALLEFKVEQTDEALKAIFRDALDSFRYYPAETRRSPAFRALISSVHARYADNCYRMGHRNAALQTWSRMLRTDPGDHDVARNRAVALTQRTTMKLAMAAWRGYLEMLYVSAEDQADFQASSHERARVHRALGGSYAISAVSRERDERWEQECLVTSEIVALVANGPRMRNFVAHKLLEVLNLHLDHRDPLLALGLSYEDGEGEIEAAATTLRLVLDQALRWTSVGVEGPIRRVLQARIDAVQEAAKGLVGVSPPESESYEEARSAHFELLVKLAKMKVRIHHALSHVVESDGVDQLTGGEGLGALCALDEIPFSNSEHFVRLISSALQIDVEPLMSLCRSSAEQLIAALMSYMMSAPVDDQVRRTQDDIYQRLSKGWARHPDMQKLVRLVDRPGLFYPDSIRQAVARRESIEDRDLLRALEDTVIDYLLEEHQRFPGLTGIAGDLCAFLELRHDLETAVDVLTRAEEHGIDAKGRIRCQMRRLQLQSRTADDDDRAADAYRAGLECVELDDEDAGWVQQCIALFVRASGTTRGHPDPRRLVETVHRWLERAANRRLDAEDLEDVREALNRGLVSAKVNRMVVTYNRWVSRRNAGIGRSQLENDEAVVRKLADEVKAESKDPAEKKQADSVLAGLRD